MFCCRAPGGIKSLHKTNQEKRIRLSGTDPRARYKPFAAIRRLSGFFPTNTKGFVSLVWDMFVACSQTWRTVSTVVLNSSTSPDLRLSCDLSEEENNFLDRRRVRVKEALETYLGGEPAPRHVDEAESCGPGFRRRFQGDGRLQLRPEDSARDGRVPLRHLPRLPLGLLLVGWSGRDERVPLRHIPRRPLGLLLVSWSARDGRVTLRHLPHLPLGLLLVSWSARDGRVPLRHLPHLPLGLLLVSWSARDGRVTLRHLPHLPLGLLLVSWSARDGRVPLRHLPHLPLGLLLVSWSARDGRVTLRHLPHLPLRLLLVSWSGCKHHLD
uniref:Uncharacterized protein n=1 Tax=Timema bartmani TaxID=61472 RepID=A0A7R9EQI6_9NEOP|nr:unnamed protein product [Timema bartmani]